MKKSILSMLTVALFCGGSVGCNATGIEKVPKKMPSKLTPLTNLYRPIGVEMDGKNLCNSTSFTQIPNSSSLFLGRKQQVNPTQCGVKSGWTLALFSMDWASSKLVFKNDVLALPTTISMSPNRTVTLSNAYDPYVTRFNGELWVAFECAGRGIIGASTCVGPLNEQTMSIDPSRTTLLVSGVNDTQQDISFSASDPKLLNFNGSLYLYWTVVYQNPTTKEFLYLTVRGMKLEQEQGNARRMWGKGSNSQSVGSNNPQLTTEVLAPNTNDQNANKVVDVFDLRQIGSKILITAGVGGSKTDGDMDSCKSPASKNYGCYRLEIFQASQPLSPGAFGKRIASNSTLPLNGQEYSRFVTLPDGSTGIMGQFLPLWNNPAPKVMSTSVARFNPHASIANINQRTGVAPGMLLHKIDVNALQFEDTK